MGDDRTIRPDDSDATEVTGATRTKPLGRGVGSLTLPEREPGETIGRYEVLEVVAKGGMGVVYEAYDPELDRCIALKLLRSVDDGGLRRVERRERMLREAQALAQLSHPNVIAVFDAGIVDGDVFIAMELVKGLTLTKWLDKTERSHAEILSVLARAGEGLVAAHDAGLVHRDIKPAAQAPLTRHPLRVHALLFGDGIELVAVRHVHQVAKEREAHAPHDLLEHELTVRRCQLARVLEHFDRAQVQSVKHMTWMGSAMARSTMGAFGVTCVRLRGLRNSPQRSSAKKDGASCPARGWPCDCIFAGSWIVAGPPCWHPRRS